MVMWSKYITETFIWSCHNIIFRTAHILAVLVTTFIGAKIILKLLTPFWFSCWQ